jgi:hypothetical protein
MRGDFGNVVMKAVTKSKRRVTLSLCGLGMLDESEVETIPDAKPFAAPTPQIPAADWKAELIALGTRAKQAAAIMTPEEQQVANAALDMAREVLKRNGNSTQEERDAATNALKQALGE